MISVNCRGTCVSSASNNPTTALPDSSYDAAYLDQQTQYCQDGVLGIHLILFYATLSIAVYVIAKKIKGKLWTVHNITQFYLQQY